MPVRKPNPLENGSIHFSTGPGSKKKGEFAFPKTPSECRILCSNSANPSESKLQHRECREKFRLLIAYIHDLMGVIKNLEVQLQQNSNASIVGKTMVAGLAHDLRNPLAVIISCAQFCLDNSELEASTKQYLHMIQENSRGASHLLNQFLEFAKVKLTFKALDLNEVIRKAWQSAVIGYRYGKVAFKAHLAEDLPEIFADPEKMERIFTNLFLNAIQAVSKTTSKGVITAQTKFLTHQSCVEVLITDNGPGIPDEIRERIFTPFFTTKAEGTGLGLHLCRHFIQQHSGQIIIDNVPQGGTMVLVTIPVTQDSSHLNILNLIQENMVP